MGLYGVTVPSEYGGAGADFLSLMIAIEEISKASGSLGPQLSFHNAVVCEALLGSQNSKLKDTVLSMLTRGKIGAFCFSSENSKIDCRIENDRILIEGASDFVMSAALADFFLVSAKLEGVSDEAIVLFSKSDANGFDGKLLVGESKKLLGTRASATADVRFDNLRLPLESLLYDIPKAADALSQLKARARLAVSAQALGIAQASVDASLRYANERAQFNTKIGRFYAVQDMIASDIVELETSRAISYDVSADILITKTLQRDTAIAKISASNAALAAARHSIRIHGGYGFTRDYPVERFARDARLTQLYTETNEELKSVIARNALGTA